MSFSNPWFWLALIATIGLYKLELLATLLNLSSLKPGVPEKLRESVSEQDLEKTHEYARVSAHFSIIQDSVSLAIFLAFWWAGGFGWVDGVVSSWGLSPIVEGLALFVILVTAQAIISLPFDIYDTFVIEAGFGFNKMTLGTFIQDRVKGIALGALLGLPLLALLLWLFSHVQLAALYGWLTLTAFSLLMSFLAPRLILPLFYRFSPLEDASLKQSIIEMARRLNFPVTEVSMVDGSKRSTKANAFFTGFGKTKRIALFDTLLNNHTQEEILAVLAHEIGHSQRKHVPKQMVLSLFTTGLMFAVLHFAIQDPRLNAAFSIDHPSVAWSMIFFTILYQPLSLLFGLGNSILSRKFEFEADAYAREAMGGPHPLSAALTKLSRDHLSNPTPHPFYVFLHYSHPPVLQRLAALGA